MKHFINLTSRVINKSHIIEIVKCPNLYVIHMTNSNIGGSLFFASGWLETNHSIIYLCEQDYDIITNLIKQTPFKNPIYITDSV